MTAYWPLWWCITEDCQLKLKALLPTGWQPPRLEPVYIQLHTYIESVVEIGKLMRKPTKWRRSGA